LTIYGSTCDKFITRWTLILGFVLLFQKAI